MLLAKCATQLGPAEGVAAMEAVLPADVGGAEVVRVDLKLAQTALAHTRLAEELVGPRRAGHLLL